VRHQLPDAPLAGRRGEVFLFAKYAGESHGQNFGAAAVSFE
jgi:hypothetical protein